MTAIVANSVLPAEREDIEFITSDGLRLVGELACPVSGPPSALIICVHPLPTHGGMMDSHVLRKMAWRLPALANIAVLRFNTRGTSSARGASEGNFDASEGEGRDLSAAVAFAQDRGLPKPWLLGWSFGTDVILRHASQLDIAGVILLSPPLRFTTTEELAAWADSPLPIVAFVPEHDDYLPPKDAVASFAVAPNIRIVAVAGAKHLWVGEKFVAELLNSITEVIAPGLGFLPEEWIGPMWKYSDLTGELSQVH
jgi:alpha/beta superfamily hydrolase